MNLPCLFTRVGLMNDPDGPTVVVLMDVDTAYGRREQLVERMATFLASLDERDWSPRDWVIAHASPERSVEGWRRVMADFEEMSGWRLARESDRPNPLMRE